ncbi:unnamed protein product, partial [Amoebophrya sp. A25]
RQGCDDREKRKREAIGRPALAMMRSAAFRSVRRALFGSLGSIVSAARAAVRSVSENLQKFRVVYERQRPAEIV